MRITTLSLALAAFMAFFAAPAHAFFEANVAAGYTTLSMGELNDAISKSTAATKTPINGGFYVSLDAGVPLAPFVKLVPRVVYIQASQGGTKSGIFESTVDSNLVPLELGLATDLELPLTGLSARAGLWGGYGLASVATSNKSGSSVVGNLYQGGAFTAEVLGALRYSVMPLFSLSLEAGYRMANIAKVNDGKNDWKKNATDPMPVDFSGLNIGGGLTFNF